MMKIAGVQMDIALGQAEANLGKILAAIAETAQAGASLTVFPECALSGYCFENLDDARRVAETIPGPATDRFAEACRRHRVWAIFGLLERDGTRVFNACALVGPEGVVGSYRKIHLPHLGVDRFVTPGDRPFAVHQAGELRVGMNICYDVSFPESSRVMALEGADLIALPTNWPPAAACVSEFTVNTRAMENHVYYIAVNRIGVEGGFSFIGRSKICAPSGAVLAEAAHDGPAILYADVDVNVSRNKHLVREPGKHEIDRFADRRPQMYGVISASPARRDD